MTRPSVARSSLLAVLICVAVFGGIWLWGPIDQGSGLTELGNVAKAELANPEAAETILAAEAEAPVNRTETDAVDAEPPPMPPVGEGVVIAGAIRDENAVAQVDAKLRLLRVVNKRADWAEFPWVEVERAQSPDAEYKFTQLERSREYAVVASLGTRWVASRPTLAPARVELVFPERFTVQATVRNLAGKPAEGATLSLVPIDGPGPQLGAASSQSHADGSVQLEVQAGRYGLAVHHTSGQLVRKEPIEVSGPTQLGDLVLAAGGEILLHVRQYGANTPIDDARIRRKTVIQNPALGDPDWKAVLAAPGGPGASEFVYDTETRAYRLAAAAPGKHEFTVSAPNYTSRSVKLVVKAGETSEETVALHPSSQLLVRLVDRQGEPVVGQKLRFEAAIEDRSFRSENPKTDEKGEVLFWGLQPRDYFVFQENEDRRPVQVDRVSVELGENEVEIVCARVEGVTIRVLQSEKPVPGAAVAISVLEQSSGPAKDVPFYGLIGDPQETDADGVVELPSLPPGEYSVAVKLAGSGRWVRRCTITQAGQLIEFDCPTRILRGQVIPAEAGVSVGLVQYTGELLSDDELLRASAYRRLAKLPHVQQSGVLSAMIWVDRMTVSTNAEGYFEFRDLGPGQVHLIAIAADGRASDLADILLADVDPAETILQLEPCASLRVETINLDKALSSTGAHSISASVLYPGAMIPLELKSLQDGLTQFEYLQPGEVTVEIRYYDIERSEKVVLQTSQVQLVRGKTEVVRWDGASAR